MDTKKVSVLMSVYKNEKPIFLRQSIDSMINQTYTPDEIVLVKDGELTDELNDVINDYLKKYPSMFNIVAIEKNVGLGLALAEGILHCRNELVARMDSDDISRKDRLMQQVKIFKNNKNVDVCGSHIKEFSGNISNITGSRKVPLTDKKIKKYQKMRDGVNHVTVMFKKSKVLKAGNYKSALLMEDSLLWVNMILDGAIFYNIDDYLVYVRAGDEMIERRGGYDYYKKYKKGRKKIKETGYINNFEYVYTLAVQFCVSMMPLSLRKFFFSKILRK